MEEKFILNCIHRPELTPEYSATVSGAKHGTEQSQTGESLDIFKIQQEIAHKNGIKCTIQMTYASLFNEEAVELTKMYHEKYGDEIALTFLGLPCPEFKKKYKTKDFCIWMFDMETKKEIVKDVFTKFYECFGFYPVSTGSYYMDADLINHIKAEYPMVKIAVATCWEEGPKAYHTCNNSWYTLFDGGPWAPWFISKENAHAPAENAADDSGIIGIPHLSRDLLACYDGNGSNFGTHPQNVLRGMIYENNEFPYLFNLIDEYRHLGKYNDGYAYNMMFVGPGWMNKMGRWEAPYSLLLKAYEDGMAYYGKLKKEGKLIDMTMDEFADFYRESHAYTTPECALWKDILYGSDKQIFWYADPFFRCLFDMNQGGALTDLRPYVAKVDWKVGIGTPSVQDCSYPFLIQEKYRAGYFTHYAGEGTVKSCKVIHDGQEVDMCLCRTEANFKHEGDKRILTLKPVDIEFNDGVTCQVQTIITFTEGSNAIETERKLLSVSDPNAEITLREYITCCYGINEYPLDMTPIKLYAEGKTTESIDYAYKNRTKTVENCSNVKALVPPIGTVVNMYSDGTDLGTIAEGYAFSPMFTLSITSDLSKKGSVRSWLKLEKAN